MAISDNAQFQYPPLPTNEDALRILRVAPGDFYDPLDCTLTTMTFGQRPKYVAISYTWGHSYPDMSRLPVSPHDSVQQFSSSLGVSQQLIKNSGSGTAHGRRSPSSPTAATAIIVPPLTVNGQAFHVGHNLYLALLHLRSPEQPLSIWADAVCINQANTTERNQQVSLMSFIYTRAISVIAWLGTKHYANTAGLFHIMWLEWKAGETQHLASSHVNGGKMRSSPKPNQSTIMRIAESTYWTRLWIVQEVCLPRLLILVYGSEIWSYECFRQQGVDPVLKQGLLPPAADVVEAMHRLLETREQRHANTMTLEKLMERFANNKCSELKDKVYGLLGCANDIHPSVEDNSGSLGSEKKAVSERRQGIGSLRVDYSRSFYEIWVSVIDFAFFHARNLDDGIRVRIDRSGQKQASTNVDIKRHHISIVRMAGIVQKVLGQKVEEEHIACLGQTVDPQPATIRAVGYIAGEIVRLGPKYTSIVSSSRAQQDWKNCWVNYCENADDLEPLRRMDEEYSARILHLEKPDVNRIRDIRDVNVTAWPVKQGIEPLGGFNSSNHRGAADNYTAMWAGVPADNQEPRICLGTGYVIGLVPLAAQLGDIVVRFWNCDVAIVMRPIMPSATSEKSTDSTTPIAFMLVGRADIAEVIDRSSTPGRDPHAEQCISGITAPGFKEDTQNMGALYVDLTLKTLQIITTYAVT